MKNLRHAFCILLSLCLLCSAALSEGILPALQTPQPELTEIISLHSVTGMEAPEPVQLEDGELEFRYTSVPYSVYLDFGRALTQENYTLVSSETGEDGAAVAVVTKDDSAPVTIRYHEDFREMTVRYPLRTTARAYDSAEPYQVNPDKASLLPELTQAISLHCATGLDRVEPERAENGACLYHYDNVPYSCYTAFSVKLGGEGYSLVSGETLPDGVSRAEVTDGNATLRIDYDPAALTMEVTYPAGVYARDVKRYADYTAVTEEQSFDLLDCASVTLRGWETVDSYQNGEGDSVSPEAGHRFIRILADVSYNSPEAHEGRSLLSNIEAQSGEETVPVAACGVYDPASDRTDTEDESVLSGRGDCTLALILEATEAQAARPDLLDLTFTDPDRAVRYYYQLEKEDILAADRLRARWGVAMSGAFAAHAAEKSAEGGAEQAAYRALAGIDFMHPDGVIIVKLRSSQAKAAAEALGAENAVAIAPALAKAINLQFSENYTRAAEGAVDETENLPDDLQGISLVILPCGEDVMVISMAGQKAACSSVISTKEISARLSAADIQLEADKLGVSRLYIREYRGEDAENLLSIRGEDAKWETGDSAAQHLFNAVKATSDSFTALFTRLKEYPAFFHAAVRGYLAGKISVPYEDLCAISAALHEPLEGDDDPPHTMLDTSGTLPSGDAVVDKVPAWGTTLIEETPDPDGTYVFMVTLHEPGTAVQTVYDWQLEAALPEKNIPRNPEDADYIIHLDITFDDSPDLSQNGISLFYPNGQINLYRASDGAWIGDYGTVTHTLTGFIMMTRGNHYWRPYRISVWNSVKTLFEQ